MGTWQNDTQKPSCKLLTGPGSFTFIVQANASGGSQSATNAVADQILLVFQGIPPGFPGRGSVVISGTPQSISVNQCPGNPYGSCWATIQEGGAVIVWVDGTSYSATYGSPSDTSLGLATVIAQKINQPGCLISTSISDVVGNSAKINITARVNGTATNSPLSTTVGFNTSQFSTPAFQGTASGACLTGGTD